MRNFAIGGEIPVASRAGDASLSLDVISGAWQIDCYRTGVTHSQLSIADALRLIRAEYHEIPGLHLTQRQVERLWGLDTSMAEALLGALIDVQFLRQTRTGAYVRATSTEQARVRLIDYDRWLNERDER